MSILFNSVFQVFFLFGYYFKLILIIVDNIIKLSIDRILSETDCPYLPPVPFRGQTNYPEYIPYIVRQMSEIKEISLDILSKKIQDNFYKLFHVKP